jgi:hypothetical protein
MRCGGTGGLPILVGFYSRLEGARSSAFQGLRMRVDGLPDIRMRAGEDLLVVRRYSSRPLTSMTPGAYWAPRKEW